MTPPISLGPETRVFHHVIAGFNTETTGESGVLAITATQIDFPAYVLLNILANFRAFRFQPKKQEMISQAIAFGSRIGLEASPLVLQRWEEGWDKPLSQWREDLGVKPVEHALFGAIY